MRSSANPLRAAPAAPAAMAPSAAGMARRSAARQGVLLATASMLSVQLGAAASIGLLAQTSPTVVAWLRLAWAGVILLVVVRPRPSSFTRSTFGACVALGLVTAGVTILFMQAVARLPLGTASALEFLGPLGVAIARGRGSQRLWAAPAAAGVLLLTQPWHGHLDLAGLAFAAGAACCWAAYILLTQRVGDDVAGLHGLGVSMPVAGLAATLVAAPALLATPSAGGLSWHLVAVGIGLALLLPVLPFTLELLALRRLTTAAFGTLMCLEPAIAALVGLIFLHQVPTAAVVAGIAFVVVAGAGAERTGGREPAPLPAMAQAAA